MIYLNDVLVTPTIFPDKTSQIWNLPKDLQKLMKTPQVLHVRWEFSNEGEFLQLAQLKDLIDSHGDILADLTIKYLPYGRQDKEIQNDATFALRTFARLLNKLNFWPVMIHDPHSQVALDLIRNSEAVYPHEQLMKSIESTLSDVVCYPDKGAVTKYSKVYPYVYVYGEKVRDQLTGKILKYSLKTDLKLGVSGARVMIVDDICDGGATFVILAKELYAAGAAEVNLFVTHGLFSKGFIPLQDAGIKRFFTQDGELTGEVK